MSHPLPLQNCLTLSHPSACESSAAKVNTTDRCSAPSQERNMVDACWAQGWYEQDEPHQAHRNKYQYSSQLRNAPEERAKKRTTSTYHCASDSYVSQLKRENKFSATLVFQSMTKQLVTPSLPNHKGGHRWGQGRSHVEDQVQVKDTNHHT